MVVVPIYSDFNCGWRWCEFNVGLAMSAVLVIMAVLVVKVVNVVAVMWLVVV